MENQIVILKEFMEFMIICTVKAYVRLQKYARQVFSVHLSSIFLVHKLIKTKEMTLSTSKQSITCIHVVFMKETS